MTDIWREAWAGITADFHGHADLRTLAQFMTRLLTAAILGSLLGFDRERKGKKAGLRTHMLVALGSALFLVLIQYPGHTSDDISRVVQGVIVGIGFLGSGTIIKLQKEGQIHGLTTAASIWFSAAVGATVGMGQLEVAAVSMILAWIIVAALRPVEIWIDGASDAPSAPDSSHNNERG